MPSPKPSKLLPLRSAVILLFALLIGAIVAGVTFLGAHDLKSAALAAGGAFAGAVLWLDKIIAT
ncbi:hypothetical protein A5664_17990 [Mycolicibacterium fortuitum]|uniref:hypothetical protein n=1 Tax=Mycolicibacterium fortuitum TaxID=1766 RepID=UPI0007ED8D74|nr:hypothetical protein [Mycolicibacterium fortuitum]OBI78436.1 hypothetical protein A5664_17990 [Mycolicibacterium fortuitum]